MIHHKTQFMQDNEKKNCSVRLESNSSGISLKVLIVGMTFGTGALVMKRSYTILENIQGVRSKKYVNDVTSPLLGTHMYTRRGTKLILLKACMDLVVSPNVEDYKK